MSGLQPERVAEFFAAARERHAIYLRRAAGRPWPWTDDPIMRQFRFTCVFRELDRTTQWFRTNVREPLRDKPEVLLATVLFRWFNRTTTGEAIFCQPSIDMQPSSAKYPTAWDQFLQDGDTSHLREAIKLFCSSGPYVTGAYIIRGEPGMSKLDGVLACVGKFWRTQYEADLQISLDEFDSYSLGRADWREMAKFLLEHPGEVRLQDVWHWLKEVPYLGPFMAYEIVSDLRHTALLDQAPDINTWANPGPGAARGLGRLRGDGWLKPGRRFPARPREQMLGEMCELLAASRDPRHWPQPATIRGRNYMTQGYSVPPELDGPGLWPVWELHEVEMWLCEADKWWRIKNGEGRTKGVYRHG